MKHNSDWIIIAVMLLLLFILAGCGSHAVVKHETRIEREDRELAELRQRIIKQLQEHPVYKGGPVCETIQCFYNMMEQRNRERDLKDRQQLQDLLQDSPCRDVKNDMGLLHAIQLPSNKWVCVEDLRWKGSIEKQRELQEYQQNIYKLEARLKEIEEADRSEWSPAQKDQAFYERSELRGKLIEKHRYIEILREKAYPGYKDRMQLIDKLSSKIFEQEQAKKDAESFTYYGGGGCGSRGGPGIRGANGQCKSWRSLR